MADLEETTETTEESTIETPAIETEAKAKGWKPKEEFHGPSEKWVDAEEFIKQSDPVYQVKRLRQALKTRDRELEAVVKFTKAQQEVAYRKGMEDLQARLDEAVELGDKEAARTVTREMDKYQKQAAPVNELPLEVAEFQERNKWFDRDDELTSIAVALAQTYAKKHQDKDLATRLEMVEEEIKRRYPEKFEKPRREIPSPVESGHPPANPSAKPKYSTAKLNDEEKLAYEQYVNRHKIMTHDDYFKGLESAGRKF